jgi:hypothetical protein
MTDIVAPLRLSINAAVSAAKIQNATSLLLALSAPPSTRREVREGRGARGPLGADSALRVCPLGGASQASASSTVRCRSTLSSAMTSSTIAGL